MIKRIVQEIREGLPNRLVWCGIGMISCSLYMFTDPAANYLVYLFGGLFFLFGGSIWEIYEEKQKRVLNTQAVSPIIGVILIVAITVILAAVIAAFFFGFAGTIPPVDQNITGALIKCSCPCPCGGAAP